MDENKIAQFVPWLLALIASIFALLFRRELGNVDSVVKRVTELERHSVTRDELDKRLQRMHEENKEVLARIEEKLDDARDERHEVSSDINAMKIEVALLARARSSTGAVI